jgi:hypothetical protein
VGYVPTDEILDALAPQIGIRYLFHLGIELGRCAVELENLHYQFKGDPLKLLIQVLYHWRNDTTGKATLGVLVHALVNAGRGVGCLETVVTEKSVEKCYISRKHKIMTYRQKIHSNVKTEEKTVTDSSQQPSQQKSLRTVSDLIKKFESPKN